LRTRHRRLTLLTIPLLAAPLGLAACSSGSSGSSASGGAALAPAALCEQLNGVFSDGPDPDADPVGYALSQILPLRGVHSSDHTVTTTLDALIAADQDLVQSNGSDKAAATTIKKSDHAINQACPGVAP
jgi:ABC-type phosphate transport system substrate-binding protein